MKHNELSVSPCPKCGAPNNMATSLVSDYSPAPGDMALCFYCGSLLVFADDLSVTLPADEVEFLLALPDAVRQQVVDMQMRLKGAMSPKGRSPHSH